MFELFEADSLDVIGQKTNLNVNVRFETDNSIFSDFVLDVNR